MKEMRTEGNKQEPTNNTMKFGKDHYSHANKWWNAIKPDQSFEQI